MAIAPYDPAALGPSQAALIDQTAASNVQQTAFDKGQLNTEIARSNAQYSDVAKPQLESSLGATGQYYSGAARNAEAQQLVGVTNQQADLQSAFGRTQMDMARQQAFAAMGLIL